MEKVIEFMPFELDTVENEEVEDTTKINPDVNE